MEKNAAPTVRVLEEIKAPQAIPSDGVYLIKATRVTTYFGNLTLQDCGCGWMECHLPTLWHFWAWLHGRSAWDKMFRGQMSWWEWNFPGPYYAWRQWRYGEEDDD